MKYELYITGAGVSADSGIPTFRGKDGFWTIGSKNYTPQEMATRYMYENNPEEFLVWYYKRFAKYRNVLPNNVHKWLSSKMLITQNIDGLDGKAGNKNYIAIHGRLDKVTFFHEQGLQVEILDAPWKRVSNECPDENDKERLTKTLLDCFNISRTTKKPEKMKSLKPFVLLFDEFYTNIYRMHEAESWMQKAKKIIFLGTSFSVNITSIALNYGLTNESLIEVIDPKPIDLKLENVKYYKMTANEYINNIAMKK
ncbi:MAG: sirtuin [Alphaproteobacteria bacterium TMED93]|nr:MAG: sirtuin [Alphaproteobacteria bacterium TMED93]|tara:strand:- start:713 stop:1474 length:762 start_codon:yes stop_codon:yes gene_type:complete